MRRWRGTTLPCLLAALLPAAVAVAAAPGLMTVQGRLVDGGQLVNDADLTLRLIVYDAGTGGNVLYWEDDRVAVVDGLYSTILGDNRRGGDAPTLPDAMRAAGTNGWLGVSIQGSPELEPRRRLLSVPYAMNATDPADLGPMAFRLADAFVIVRTTDSATENGANLLAAYVSARSVEPNGAARGPDNRVAVLVPPGQYDLVAGRLLLDQDYIDIIGVSSAPEDAYILSRTGGSGSGVLLQSADDVRIENLRVRCARTGGLPTGTSSDPAAYFPLTNLALTRIRNCRFETTAYGRAMRTHITYSGTFENCHASDYGFGGGGTASGTFRNCSGGNYSFGGAGTASGSFYDCRMTGTAWSGTLSGTMESCTWGAAVTTGGAGKVLRSTIQGVFRNDGNAAIDGDLTVDAITAGNLGPLAMTRSAGLVIVQTTDNETTNGQNLLSAYTTARGMTPHGMARSGSNRVVVVVPPGRYNLGTGYLNLSAQYVDVVGLSPVRENQYIFGTTLGNGFGVLSQSANDVRIENLFVECTKSTGSLFGLDPSDPAAYFPNSGLAKTVVRNCRFSATHDTVYSLTMRVAVNYAGTYEGVIAGKNSFGFGSAASGVFIRCTGGQDSFGSAGTASGTFIECVGTAHSFGGTRSAGSSATGTFRNCTYQNDDGSAFFPTHSWGGTLSGRMEGCNWRADLRLANGAVVYDSTIVGAVTGSGAFGSCKVAHTRARSMVLTPLTNDIDAPSNVVDADVE